MKERRGAFAFEKKHLDLKPESLPIRDLIERPDEQKDKQQDPTQEKEKSTIETKEEKAP